MATVILASIFIVLMGWLHFREIRRRQHIEKGITELAATSQLELEKSRAELARLQHLINEIAGAHREEREKWKS